MRKSVCRAGIYDVAGIITSLTGQRIENLNHKDDTSGKAVLTGLPIGYLQRLIHFKACIRMKLKAGVMVHEDWPNNVPENKSSENFRSPDMFMIWAIKFRTCYQWLQVVYAIKMSPASQETRQQTRITWRKQTFTTTWCSTKSLCLFRTWSWARIQALFSTPHYEVKEE